MNSNRYSTKGSRCGLIEVLAEDPIGVNPWPLRWCQRPALDANTHSGVQRYGRQLLWPACAAELLSSETRRELKQRGRLPHHPLGVEINQELGGRRSWRCFCNFLELPKEVFFEL
ncbi:hypothetical protein Taro_005847 [Colocasia esculenta]|uniref:Uncharacterized protein n=1 Tax=Colocasia esculenta TaxID=4460 RepID=A0A843TTL8_COLES|nr:hypothetical protein [Colocasia esculenta]